MSISAILIGIGVILLVLALLSLLEVILVGAAAALAFVGVLCIVVGALIGGGVFRRLG